MSCPTTPSGLVLAPHIPCVPSDILKCHSFGKCRFKSCPFLQFGRVMEYHGLRLNHRLQSHLCALPALNKSNISTTCLDKVDDVRLDLRFQNNKGIVRACNNTSNDKDEPETTQPATSERKQNVTQCYTYGHKVHGSRVV